MVAVRGCVREKGGGRKGKREGEPGPGFNRYLVHTSIRKHSSTSKIEVYSIWWWRKAHEGKDVQCGNLVHSTSAEHFSLDVFDILSTRSATCPQPHTQEDFHSQGQVTSSAFARFTKPPPRLPPPCRPSSPLIPHILQATRKAVPGAPSSTEVSKART